MDNIDQDSYVRGKYVGNSHCSTLKHEGACIPLETVVGVRHLEAPAEAQTSAAEGRWLGVYTASE